MAWVLGHPYDFKPSLAKLKTDTSPASPAKLKNALAMLKYPPRKSSEYKNVLEKADEILIATLAIGQQMDEIRRIQQTNSTALGILKNTLADEFLVRAQEGIDEVLGTVGTTWNEVQAKRLTFDHDDSPDPALPSKYLQLVWENFMKAPRNILDIKTMDQKFTQIANLVYVAKVYVGPIRSNGVDDKNIPIIARRRNSTDTMSTISIPPLPYGLVDWVETQRLRELMG